MRQEVVRQSVIREANRYVAGVDEAGRGPLAGPVVAAAVILDSSRPITGLRDSKRLTERQRTRLDAEIRRHAVAFALAWATVEEIDSINILQASLLAMERAVSKLKVEPTLVRIDGNQIPHFSGRAPAYSLEAIVSGDRIVAEISAASILAKVCRDKLLFRLHRRYPDYAFCRNKGYPTRAHLDALREHGPCAAHRTSFEPVRQARKVSRA
jgi:ribonuclease HII